MGNSFRKGFQQLFVALFKGFCQFGLQRGTFPGQEIAQNSFIV